MRRRRLLLGGEVKRTSWWPIYCFRASACPSQSNELSVHLFNAALGFGFYEDQDAYSLLFVSLHALCVIYGSLLTSNFCAYFLVQVSCELVGDTYLWIGYGMDASLPYVILRY